MTYAEEGAKTIAFDFDGVIHSGTYPAFAPPNDKAVEAIRRLKADGWRILIFTARLCHRWYKGMSDSERWVEYLKTMQDLRAYLKKYDIPFDKIWTGEGKPYCRYYVDDSAIEYVGQDIYEEVNKREELR